jgi:uncharacterized protein (DUF2141 family)
MTLSAIALIGAAPTASVEISISELRSSKGQVLVCLVRDKAGFPDCSHDHTARRATMPAVEGEVLRIDGLPSGHYAAALIHDENGNGKLDTRIGIPAEGVAFSRNPRFTFGPPSFRAATFELSSGTAAEAVRFRYFL